MGVDDCETENWAGCKGQWAEDCAGGYGKVKESFLRWKTQTWANYRSIIGLSRLFSTKIPKSRRRTLSPEDHSGRAGRHCKTTRKREFSVPHRAGRRDRRQIFLQNGLGKRRDPMCHGRQEEPQRPLKTRYQAYKDPGRQQHTRSDSVQSQEFAKIYANWRNNHLA